MDALQVLLALREANPERTFAPSKDGTAIGVLCPELGLYYPVYMRAITGQWVNVSGSVTLLNGQLPYQPDDWLV